MLTKEDFFINSNFKEIADAYETFKWIDKNICKKEVILISAFGDLLFKDFFGSIHMLDLIEGKINKIAKNTEDLQNRFNTKEFQENIMLSNLLLTLKENGIKRNDSEVFAFIVPMIMGGKAESDNIHVMDLKVWIHMIGQIHEQIKDLPPGTKINKIQIE